MFGLNKKLKQTSKNPTKTNGKTKTSGKQGVISSTANKKKSSITAIPDLICKVKQILSAFYFILKF
jgi:hypothetical protein